MDPVIFFTLLAALYSTRNLCCAGAYIKFCNVSAETQAGMNRRRHIVGEMNILVKQWIRTERMHQVSQRYLYIEVEHRGLSGLRLSEFVQISEFFSIYITDICQTSESFAKSVNLK